MKPELIEEEYTAIVTGFKSQLCFISIPAKIEAEYQDRLKEDAKYHEHCIKEALNYKDDDTWLKRLRSEAAGAMESYLSRLSRGTESFPSRHIQNLKKALENNHPQWRGKFNGILEKLGNGSIFILTGPRGTGKTQLAAAVGRYLAETKNQESSYTVLGELFTRIKGTFKSDSPDSEESIVSSLSRSSLLVLDECHEITGTEWQGRILTLLIDSRYRERRDTIMITNQAQDAFLVSVGESITDRIAECGYFIECDWPSFRRARL